MEGGAGREGTLIDALVLLQPQISKAQCAFKALWFSLSLFSSLERGLIFRRECNPPSSFLRSSRRRSIYLEAFLPLGPSIYDVLDLLTPCSPFPHSATDLCFKIHAHSLPFACLLGTPVWTSYKEAPFSLCDDDSCFWWSRFLLKDLSQRWSDFFLLLLLQRLTLLRIVVVLHEGDSPRGAVRRKEKAAVAVSPLSL